MPYVIVETSIYKSEWIEELKTYRVYYHYTGKTAPPKYDQIVDNLNKILPEHTYHIKEIKDV